MKNKTISYSIIIISIILILLGGYLRINHGNNYDLIFIGGFLLLILRFGEFKN
jgi:hypothetical protein